MDSNDDDSTQDIDQDRSLNEGQLRIEKRVLFDFFEYQRSRTSEDSNRRDAQCKKCKIVIKSSKPSREFKHAFACHSTEPERIALLKSSLSVDEAQTYGTALDKKTIEDEKLVRFLSLYCLPFRLLNCKAFRDFLQVLAPRYRLPARSTIAGKRLPEMAAKIAKQNVEYLNNQPKYSLMLEMDGWSSSCMHIHALIATDLSGRSFLIDLIDISDSPGTANRIAEVTLEAMKNSGLNMMQFNAIISDEAANYKKAREIIVKKLKFRLLEFRCMAHLSNLIIGAICKTEGLDAVMADAASIVRFIHRSKAAASKIRNKGGNMVVSSVVTRWYSVSESINSLLSIRDVLEELVSGQDSELFAAVSGIVNSAPFWKGLQDMKPYLDALSCAIGVQERSSCSLAEGFHALLIFAHKVWLTRDSSESREIYEVVFDAFLSNVSKLNLEMLLAAYMMEPRFRGRFITDYGVQVSQVKIISILLQEKVLRSIDDKERFEEAYRVYVNEIKASPLVDKSTSDWWQQSTSLLKHAGLRFATCKSSSANTERVFSALTQIMSNRRNRIALSTAKDIMIVKLDSTESKKQRDVRPPPDESNTQSSSHEEDGAEDELEISLPDISSLELTDDSRAERCSATNHPFYEAFIKIIDLNEIEPPSAPIQEEGVSEEALDYEEMARGWVCSQ